MLWLFTLMAPVVINGLVFEQISRLVAFWAAPTAFRRTCGTFCVVLTYHAIKNTGDVLEEKGHP